MQIMKKVPKLSLLFICKNNSSTIKRMIDSCLPIIDEIIAIDTGSVDDTMDKIKSYRKSNRIRIVLKEELFINFAFNRTSLMKLAKKEAKNTHLLLMDTDEELLIDKDFKIPDLIFDTYFVKMVADGIVYKRDKVLSNRLSWKWRGYAHEYPVKPQGHNGFGNLSGLSIKIFPKNQNYPKNIIRNYKLLLEQYKETPDDPRTLFYLGESCRDINFVDDSIKFYKKRIDCEGWDEEVYLSFYNIGLLYKKKNDIESAKINLLKAIARIPSRPEAYFELSKIYIDEENHTSARVYLKILVELEPSNDSLFLNPNILKYEAKFRLAVESYWTERYTESIKYAKDVSMVERVPLNIRHQNLINLTYAWRKFNETHNKGKRLVIQVPQEFDGLGDHLFFSHIPKLAKEQGYESVYISSFNKYKTNGTKELVWEANPYVDGQVNEYGTFYDSLNNIFNTLLGAPVGYCPNNAKGNLMMHRLANLHGLNTNDFDGLPYINIEEIKSTGKSLGYTNLKNKILFDGNWKSYIGIDQEKLKLNLKVNFDYQIFPLNEHCIIIPDTEIIPSESLFEYAYLILTSKEFYCVMSGGAVLSAALRKKCNVFDSKLTNYVHKFLEFNNHINL